MNRSGVAAVLLTGALLRAETIPVVIKPHPSNTLHLYVEKTGLMSGKKHDFTFQEYEGRIDLDSTAPANSRVNFKIRASSIVCKDTWISAKDLRKVTQTALEDMMAADRHPWIEFVSGSIRQAGPDSFEITGLLAVRGIQRPVTFTVKRGAAFEGRAIVKLTNYGLKPPSAALGLVGTKDEMIFEFSLAPGS